MPAPGAKSQTTASGALDCSPGIAAALARIDKFGISVRCLDTLSPDGIWELCAPGRCLIALDAEAARRAYRYLLTADTAPACRAVDDLARLA